MADWGGGWDGLDAAEQLAGAGVEITLACAAPVPGETLHQYQRNLYLARLDELGVEILHHTELAVEEGEVRLRHVFSGRPGALPEMATLVLAQGREPADELWAELEQHPGSDPGRGRARTAHARGGRPRGDPGRHAASSRRVTTS